MKPPKRKETWPEILAEEIRKGQHRKFKYGSHDCCMFANRVIKAMTGRSIAKKLKGYTTAVGAIETLKNKGSGTLNKTMDVIMKENGCPKAKHLGLLKRGDVCMAKLAIEEVTGGKEEYCVGIVLGTIAAFASDGLVMIDIGKVTKGWHCG